MKDNEVGRIHIAQYCVREDTMSKFRPHYLTMCPLGLLWADPRVIEGSSQVGYRS
jgi:hypothetical protein